MVDLPGLLLLVALTVLELTTFTVSVWPEVPGFNWSTLMNTGFLFATAVLLVLLVFPVATVAISMGVWSKKKLKDEKP